MQRAWDKSTLIMFFLFSSCHSIKLDVIQTGPYFTPVKADKVEFYTDKKDIKYPFGAIAIIHSERFDCSDKVKKSIINKARKKSSLIGGDAIIYYFDYGEKDPYAKPEEKCFFSGVAVKYISDDVKKQIETFKVEF